MGVSKYTPKIKNVIVLCINVKGQNYKWQIYVPVGILYCIQWKQNLFHRTFKYGVSITNAHAPAVRWNGWVFSVEQYWNTPPISSVFPVSVPLGILDFWYCWTLYNYLFRGLLSISNLTLHGLGKNMSCGHLQCIMEIQDSRRATRYVR